MKTFSNAGLPPLAVKTQLYFTADVHFSLPRRLFITLPACADPVAPGSVSLFLFPLQTDTLFKLPCRKTAALFHGENGACGPRFHIWQHL